MDQHSNFQHSFWDVFQELTYHYIWPIWPVGVILCDKRILLERGLPYALKSPNKQLVYAFLHFVASLKCRFYTFTLIFVSEVNIYPYSLRLLKVDPVVSRLLATNRQYFSILKSNMMKHWYYLDAPPWVNVVSYFANRLLKKYASPHHVLTI